MAFNDKEISTEDGSPISLYEFKWGNTYWRYTSGDREIEYPDDVFYTPISIKDDGVVQGGSSANDFTVTAQADIPITTLFAGTPPSETITLTVRRQHPGEADAPIYLKGTVGNVKRKDLAEVLIIVRSLTATFKRTGLRLTWTRGCPHALYDSNCKVNREAFKVIATITAKAGVSITVNATGKPLGWFDGGYLSWEANEDGTLDRRPIDRGLTDKQFTLLGGTDRLEIGQEINLYPGCPLVKEVCDSKYDNLANYGGFDFMPGKSPFDGTPVF